ncbi:MULE domain-containing protein, partial [Aphis craccivora]
HRERRSRSRSPITRNILDVVGGDENNPFEHKGIRGHLVYMAANGYTYFQNHTSINRILHNHRPGHGVEIGQFLAAPRSRVEAETYEEESRSPFFQEPLEYIIGDETVFGGFIFANIEFLRNYLPFMRRPSVIAIDDTFEFLPRIPGDMVQLITIHSIPVVYIILNQRTELAYSRLVKFLRNDFPFDLLNWQGIKIITDCETALRIPTRRVLPESQLIGCWFHFNQFIALPHLPREILQEYPENFIFLQGFWKCRG